MIPIINDRYLYQKKFYLHKDITTNVFVSFFFIFALFHNIVDYTKTS